VAYFPFELLLGANLTARQVFELVVLALLGGGLEDTWSGLIDFLNVAVVTPPTISPTPLMVHHQVGVAGYVHDSAIISHRRESVLHLVFRLVHNAFWPRLAAIRFF
jgi:hypothetical protein